MSGRRSSSRSRSRSRLSSREKDKVTWSGSTVGTTGTGSSIDSGGGGGSRGTKTLALNVNCGGISSSRSSHNNNNNVGGRGRSVRKEDARPSTERARSDRAMREEEEEERRASLAGRGRSVRRSEVPSVAPDVGGGGGRSRGDRSLLERGRMRAGGGGGGGVDGEDRSSRSASRSRRRSAADVAASIDGSRRGGDERDDDDRRRRRGASSPRSSRPAARPSPPRPPAREVSIGGASGKTTKVDDDAAATRESIRRIKERVDRDARMRQSRDNERGYSDPAARGGCRERVDLVSGIVRQIHDQQQNHTVRKGSSFHDRGTASDYIRECSRPQKGRSFHVGDDINICQGPPRKGRSFHVADDDSMRRGGGERRPSASATSTSGMASAVAPLRRFPAVSSSMSISMSMATSVSSSSSRMRHPMDKVLASLDVHHHRRGGRYRDHDGGAPTAGGGGGGGGGGGPSPRSTSRPRDGHDDDEGRGRRAEEEDRRCSIADSTMRQQGRGPSPSLSHHRQQRRAGTPGPKTGGAARHGRRDSASRSRSPSRRVEDGRENNAGESGRDLLQRRPAAATASVHSSVHSRRAEDRSVVSHRSHRSHRSQKSRNVAPERALPIEITIGPDEVRRSVNANSSREDVDRHQRTYSRSPVGSGEDRPGGGGRSDDGPRGREPPLPSDRCPGRPPSDHRSFSRGRTAAAAAASAHSSVHSRRAEDRSVVSHRSHRSNYSQKSRNVAPEHALPIEITIGPDEVRRSLNATSSSRRSSSTGRRRGDDETHEAVDMKRVESTVCMLTAMNLVEAALKKVAAVSTTQSSPPLVANDKAQLKSITNNSRPRSYLPLTSGGNGNTEDSNDVSSHYSKASSSSSSSSSSSLSVASTGPQGGNAAAECAVPSRPVVRDAVESRSFHSSNDDVQLDENGCCIYHPFVQLRRPNGGGGWRIMSRTCALCVDEDAERSKRESAAAVASAAFKDVAAKISSLKVSDSVNRLKIAMAQELHSTSIASPQSVPSITNGSGGNNNNTIRPHPLERQHSMLNTTTGRQRLLDIQLTSNDSLDSSGRDEDEDEDEDEESITPSFLESSSSSSDSGSSIASAQSSSEDPEVLSDVLDSESSVHSIHSNQKTSNNAQPKLKSSASRRYSASAASDKKPSAPRRSSDRPSTANSISGSSTGKSASKRPPPPPPPPRTIKVAANNSSDTKCKNVHNDISMAVLNPHPEPELQGEFPFIEITTQQQHFSPEVKRMPQDPFPRPGGTMDVQQQPEWQHQEAPVVGKSNEWMKYATKASRRDTKDGNSIGRKSKMFRRESSKKLAMNEQIKSCTVKQMPFTDQFGDFGFYTGQVDDEGRPDGKGIMKYENGVFYEGTWTNGGQDKLAASQYERIRGGFTSWGGKGKGGTKSGSTLPWNSRKNDAFDHTVKTNVRGMEWTDLNGDSGRYTGEVDNDQLPHGSGIMRYDFGLIAEGEWVHGVLKEGPLDRMISAAAMNGGQSVAPGMPINSGMSVGPGAVGYAGGAVSVLGAGGMSVAPPLGFGGGMAPPVANPMQYRGMNPSQRAMFAHQNAMMKMYGGAAGSVYGGGGSVYYGGAGSVYGGPGMAMPMQQMPQIPYQPMQQVAMQQQQQPQQHPNHQPPISNIVLK